MSTNVISIVQTDPHLRTAQKIRRYEQRLVRAVKTGWPDFSYSRVLKVGSEYSYHPDFHDLTFTLNERHNRGGKWVVVTVAIRVQFRKEYGRDGLYPTGAITVTIQNDHDSYKKPPLTLAEPKEGHSTTILATDIIEMAKRGFTRHLRREQAGQQTRPASTR